MHIQMLSKCKVNEWMYASIYKDRIMKKGSRALLLYLLLEPLQVALEQLLPRLHEPLHAALEMRILWQLILVLHLLVGVVGEVVVARLLLLEVGGVVEGRQIVEGEVQPVVVQQQVPPKRVHLVDQPRRGVLDDGLQQFQALQTNEDALGLQILATESGRDGAHEVLLHSHALLLFQQLDHLQRARVDGLVLDHGVVLVGRGVDLQCDLAGVFVLRVEDNLEESDVAAQLVQRRTLVQRVQQLLQFLQQSLHCLRLHLGEIGETGQYLLDAFNLRVAVLLHGLLQPLLVLGAHLLELRLAGSVGVLQ